MRHEMVAALPGRLWRQKSELTAWWVLGESADRYVRDAADRGDVHSAHRGSTGADGHSQVNRLPLAQEVVFDWLDEVLEPEPAAPGRATSLTRR